MNGLNRVDYMRKMEILFPPSLLNKQRVGHHEGGHSLDNWHGARYDTRVMTSLDGGHNLLMERVHRRLFHKDCGSRLKGHTEIDILSIGDAALDAATVICASANKIGRAHV